MGLEVAAAAADVLAAQRAWEIARVAVIRTGVGDPTGTGRDMKENPSPEEVTYYQAQTASRSADYALREVGGNEWDIRAARTAEANVYWMRKYNPSGQDPAE